MADEKEKLAPGLYLLAGKMEVDGTNGHFSWHCRIEEVDEAGNTMHGPLHQMGLGTDLLHRDHDGDHRNFLLNEVKPQLIAHYLQWKHDHAEGKKLEGQRL